MDAQKQDAIKLIAESREAVLATLEEGKPFTSAVNYFYLPGPPFGTVCFLMSDLARHAKNVKRNSHVSLQVIESTAAPLYQRPRVSVQGEVETVTDAGRLAAYREAYLKHFPSAQIFFTLADFRFYELKITELYFIAGFGKAQSFI